MRSIAVSRVFFILLLFVSSHPALSAEIDETGTQEMVMPSPGADSPPAVPSATTPEVQPVGPSAVPPADTPAAPPERPPVLPRDEEILIQSKRMNVEPIDKTHSYFIQSGGALPIYDEDFRDFLDYGGSITLGMKQRFTTHLYVTPTLGITLLNGDWEMHGSRESTQIEQQFYNTTYGNVSPDDVNPVNTGTGFWSGGEALVTDSEFLRNIDLETSMYIIPLCLNLTYQLHEEGVRKINPYIGGGAGFCVATRQVESRTLKEKQYVGPDYYLDFNDDQTVTGQMFQLFAGIEIPFQKNMKIIAESNTTFYNLRAFDPIVSISPVRPTPASYGGSDLSSYSLEDPVDIGVFREEYVTTLSIGLIVPF